MSGLAVVAAVSMALSNALQHHGAGQAAGAAASRVGALAGLVRRPAWLAGIAVGVIAAGLQAAALSMGALSVVQPLLVCALLFAMPITRRLTGRRMGLGDYGWAAVVVGGLAFFLAAAHPTAGLATVTGRALAAGRGVGLAAVACLVAAARRTDSRHCAWLLAVATGICCGLGAVLMKQVIAIWAAGGLITALASWPLWVLAVVGAATVLLGQSAYQAGPLTVSLPAITITEPLVASLLCVTAFGETLTIAWSMTLLALLGLTGTMVAVMALVRRAAPLVPDKAAPDSVARSDTARG